MFKACSRCGKIHRVGFACTAGKTYTGGEERALRGSYAWTQKALEIKERANYLCEVCRAERVYTHETLEVHHIEKLSENKDKLLDDLNLVCLCVPHHKAADRGEITPEYLQGLALARERRWAEATE